MNKKRMCIVCVIMVFGIMAGCFLEEKYENHIPMKPDVVSSISINRDQYLTVVANRDRIEDKEEFAKLLVEMCRQNSFRKIKFSTDRGYATGVNMRVYLWKDEIEGNDPVLVVEYSPDVNRGDFDIVNDPKRFGLFIDGKRVKNSSDDPDGSISER